MKLGVRQGSVQSDTEVNNYILGAESYATVAASPSSPTWSLPMMPFNTSGSGARHGFVRGQQPCDGGLGVWLAWQRRCVLGGGGGGVVAAVAAAGEGLVRCGQCTRWRASCPVPHGGGRLPVILHRQVLHSGTDPLKRRGGASASVHRQSVLFLVVNRDRYPQVAFMSGLWEHFIDKVVDVPVVTRRGAL